MLKERHVFAERIKQENPSEMIAHCLHHRENLASKKLSPELKKVTQEDIHVVNFIKARGLKSRIFAKM